MAGDASWVEIVSIKSSFKLFKTTSVKCHMIKSGCERSKKNSLGTLDEDQE